MKKYVHANKRENRSLSYIYIEISLSQYMYIEVIYKCIYVVYYSYQSRLLLEKIGRKYVLQELIFTSLAILLMRTRVSIHITITTLSVSIIQSRRPKHIMCKTSRIHEVSGVHSSRGGTSPEISRYRVVVLTLVSCNHNCWILQ